LAWWVPQVLPILINAPPQDNCRECLAPTTLCIRKHLAGIHNAMRIECLFDGAHNLQAGSVLGSHELAFSNAYAMLTGARSAHAEHPVDQAPVECVGQFLLMGVALGGEHSHVQVPVTSVGASASDEPVH